MLSPMPYEMDLSTFSLDRFAEVLTTVEPLPSRRILVDHIVDITARLGAEGVSDIEELRKLLADKKRYETIGEDLGVDAAYLTVLNREVNSYRTKPLPLAKLNFLTADELAVLEGVGIRSTKALYERCAAKSDRYALAEELAIDTGRLVETLRLANLVRINGVGPSFARFLLDLGVRGPDDLRLMETDEIVRRYSDSIAGEPNQPKLRGEDIEYCKRFCEGLQDDVE